MKNTTQYFLSRGDMLYIAVAFTTCIITFLSGAISETPQQAMIWLSLPCSVLVGFSVWSTRVNGVLRDFISQEKQATQTYMLGFVCSLCSIAGSLGVNPSQAIGDDLITIVSSKLIITIVAIFCYKCMFQIAETWRSGQAKDIGDVEEAAEEHQERLIESMDLIREKTEKLTEILSVEDLSKVPGVIREYVEQFSKGSDDLTHFMGNFSKNLVEGDKALSGLASGLAVSQREMVGSLEELRDFVINYQQECNNAFSAAREPAEGLQNSLMAIDGLVGRLQAGLSNLSPERLGQSLDVLERHGKMLADESAKQLRMAQVHEKEQVQTTESVRLLNHEVENLATLTGQLSVQMGDLYRKFDEEREEQNMAIRSILADWDKLSQRMIKEKAKKRSWFFWNRQTV